MGLARRVLAFVAVLLSVAVGAKQDHPPIDLPCGAFLPHFTDEAKEGMKLVQVQIIARHGDRTPERYMPGDETVFTHECDGKPCTGGQLTSIGETQAFALGKFLQYRYMEQLPFLKSSIQDQNLRVECSHSNRTCETALGIVRGLYPETVDNELEPETVVEDTLFPASSYCKNLPNLYAEARNRWNESKKAWEDELLTRVEHSIEESGAAVPSWFREGFSGTTFMFPNMFYSINARRCHGISQGDYFQDEDLKNQVVDHAFFTFVKTYAHHVWNAPMVFLWEHLFGAMPSSGGSSKPFIIHGSHDSTISTLAVKLNLNKWPAYVSTLLFEVYEDDKAKLWIRVASDNDLSTPLVALDTFKNKIMSDATALKARCEPAHAGEYHGSVGVRGRKKVL